VTRCTDIAAVKVVQVTELIQRAIDSDAAARLTGGVGMVTSTSDDVSAEASVQVSHKVSHSDSVDMKAAEETAMTLMSGAVSDEESSSLSVVEVASVPAAVVLDSGIHL